MRTIYLCIDICANRTVYWRNNSTTVDNNSNDERGKIAVPDTFHSIATSSIRTFLSQIEDFIGKEPFSSFHYS